MDSHTALLKSQKTINHALLKTFCWWRKSRSIVAEQFKEQCDELKVSREVASRAMHLFERASTLHGKKHLNINQTLLDAGVAFMISVKFSDTDNLHTLEDMAISLEVSEPDLREAERVFLQEVNWSIYSPTPHQFVDVLAHTSEERTRALSFLDSHALSHEVSCMTAEELARGALHLINNEDGPSVNRLRTLYTPQSPSKPPSQPQMVVSVAPKTVCGKRTRTLTTGCGLI